MDTNRECFLKQEYTFCKYQPLLAIFSGMVADIDFRLISVVSYKIEFFQINMM